MADKSIKISIKTALDAAGIQATQTQLDQMAEHIRGVNASVRRGMNVGSKDNGFVKSFHQAKEAALKFVGVFTAVVATFKAGYEIGKKAREIFLETFSTAYRESKKAEKSCADFNEAMKEAAETVVQKLADKYGELSSAISKVNEARQRHNQLIKDELKYSRDAADAQLELAKQQELASIAPGDEKGRADIESRYALKGTLESATRRKADAVLKRQELDRTATDSRSAAGKIDEQIKEAEKALRGLLTRAHTLALFAKNRNEADKTNFFGAYKPTEEGDKIRENYKNDSKKAQAEADKLEKNIAKMKAEAERLRANADAADAGKTALFKEIETAEVMMKSATLKAANDRAEAEAKADAEIEKARVAAAEKAAKFRAEAEAKFRKKTLADEANALKARHTNRMKQLDEEARKANDAIGVLLGRGADDPMGRAGGGGWQRDELRAERQGKINAERIANEGDKIKDKLGDFWEANIDDPDAIAKLGRLSNIQRAALEKLQLEKQQKKLKDIEEKKNKAIEDMDKSLKDILDRLDGVGL